VIGRRGGGGCVCVCVAAPHPHTTPRAQRDPGARRRRPPPERQVGGRAGAPCVRRHARGALTNVDRLHLSIPRVRDLDAWDNAVDGLRAAGGGNLHQGGAGRRRERRVDGGGGRCAGRHARVALAEPSLRGRRGGGGGEGGVAVWWCVVGCAVRGRSCDGTRSERPARLASRARADGRAAAGGGAAAAAARAPPTVKLAGQAACGEGGRRAVLWHAARARPRAPGPRSV
jgi:hypothetical protein